MIKNCFVKKRQSDKTPLDGCTAMRYITNECPGLQEPGRIRTREMRRYLATTTQVGNRFYLIVENNFFNEF